MEILTTKKVVQICVMLGEAMALIDAMGDLTQTDQTGKKQMEGCAQYTIRSAARILGGPSAEELVQYKREELIQAAQGK